MWQMEVWGSREGSFGARTLPPSATPSSRDRRKTAWTCGSSQLMTTLVLPMQKGSCMRLEWLGSWKMAWDISGGRHHQVRSLLYFSWSLFLFLSLQSLWLCWNVYQPLSEPSSIFVHVSFHRHRFLAPNTQLRVFLCLAETVSPWAFWRWDSWYCWSILVYFLAIAMPSHEGHQIHHCNWRLHPQVWIGSWAS